MLNLWMLAVDGAAECGSVENGGWQLREGEHELLRCCVVWRWSIPGHLLLLLLPLMLLLLLRVHISPNIFVYDNTKKNSRFLKLINQ